LAPAKYFLRLSHSRTGYHSVSPPPTFTHILKGERGFWKSHVGGTTTTENIMKQLLEAIKVKFEIRLQEKTGWGRNEIIRAYNDCVTEALLEHLG